MSFLTQHMHHTLKAAALSSVFRRFDGDVQIFGSQHKFVLLGLYSFALAFLSEICYSIARKGENPMYISDRPKSDMGKGELTGIRQRERRQPSYLAYEIGSMDPP